MKKLLIYTTSTLLLLIGLRTVLVACGPYTDPYDYFVSFFHNDVSGGKQYSNFYYTRYSRLYNFDESTSEAEINAAEWEAALDKKVSARDIQKIMYQLEPKADSLLTQKLEGSGINIPDSLASNPFVKFLLDQKKNAYREYYVFAKHIEYSSTRYDPWDPAPIDTLSRISLLEKSLSLASKTKNKFLKLRYYYQACKGSLFTGKGRQAVDIYDQFIEKQAGSSHVKGWGLALKAGAVGALGDSVLSAYYYSKVFADYPERRVSAYRDFRDKRLPIADVLALTKNNEEKAVIWAITGLGDPAFEMEYLEKIYELAPSSEMLGVLLARELNKLEEAYHTEFVDKKELFYTKYQFYQWLDPDSLPESKLKAYLKHLQQLKVFSLKLSVNNKYVDAGLGNIAAAYLCWMQHDTKEGWTYLRKIREAELSSKLKDQEKLVRLLLSAQQIKDFNTINEVELLPVLTWLEQKTTKENTAGYFENNYDYFGENRFSASARNFYQLILAPAYLKRGDTVNAALAMLKGDPYSKKEHEHGFGSWQTTSFFQTSLRLAALKKLINIKNGGSAESNNYQVFLQNRMVLVNSQCLAELTGTACLREHQFAQATSYLKQVPKEKRARIINGGYASYLVGNPFTDRMRDYPTVQDSANGYDKLRYANEMASLEQKIKKDPAHAAHYYYRMANGFYNAAAYSSSWYLISYGWAAADEGTRDLYSYDKDYIRAHTAEKYYAKARVLSKDLEFKARCTFMLAKCRQKRFVYPEYDYDKWEQRHDQYLTKNTQNPYFKELKASYSKTRFYSIAAGECSYFREYLKGN